MTNRLKELRLRNHYTLDDIEAHTGIKRGTYNNYENGKTEPKLKTLQKLAMFYGVSVSYLQGLEGSIRNTNGIGYSKEYFYTLMLNACRDSIVYVSKLLYEAKETRSAKALRRFNLLLGNSNEIKDPVILKKEIFTEVSKYCVLHEINVPSIEEVQYKFWEDNFNFIFEYSPIRVLLTTKDSLKEIDIYGILVDILKLHNYETFFILVELMKSDTTSSEKENWQTPDALQPQYKKFQTEFEKVIYDYFDSLDK